MSLKKKHPEQSYKSCAGILNLGKKFGNNRLENACKRALDYEKYSYHMVKSILEKGLDIFQEESTYEEKKYLNIKTSVEDLIINNN